jgi:hypothetical protein
MHLAVRNFARTIGLIYPRHRKKLFDLDQEYGAAVSQM